MTVEREEKFDLPKLDKTKLPPSAWVFDLIAQAILEQKLTRDQLYQALRDFEAIKISEIWLGKK